MNLYEIVALGEYFYAFPSDRTFDEVLGMFTGDVIHETDEVIVWEPFERMPREKIAELTTNLKEVLEKLFIPREGV